MRRPTPLMMALALALTVSPARANPTGPTVVNGQVTINQSGNLLSVSNSPNSIVNWQSFSIGANEITRFTQQSAASAILNRVVGAGGAIDPSVILGTLQSNGRVFLINPSGIVFGAGAQIDVAGLVASSLNLSNADFLGGRLRFTEVPGAGAVVNQGAINSTSGGQVYLVGSSVTNSGVITSPKGEVILAAGNSVELVNPGTPNLRVEITAPDNEARNLGSIIAEAGRIGIYAGLINHSGTIRADKAVATDDGRIILKATKDINLGAGSVTTANGPAGGRIEVISGGTTLVAGAVEANGTSVPGHGVHLQGDTVRVMTPVATSATLAIVGAEIAANADMTAGRLSVSGTGIAINAPLSVSGDALLSGTSITTNASTTVGGNLTEIANTISNSGAMHVGGTFKANTLGLAITSPVDAQQVELATNSLTLTDTITAAASIDIATSTRFCCGTIEVGAASAGPHNMLYLTGPQVNTLLKAPILRIGNDSVADIKIVGSIALADAGALVFRTKNVEGFSINVNAPISTSGDISLTSKIVNINAGGSLRANSGSIGVVGDATISGPVIATLGSITVTGRTLNTTAPLLAESGSIELSVDAPSIGALVETTGSGNDIKIHPASFVPIDLGGNGGYLGAAELARLRPGSGVLRIGDLSSTAGISVYGEIARSDGQNLNTLNLISGRGVTEMAGSTISVPNLAVRAIDAITLNGNNSASMVTLQSTNGDVSYRYAGAGPLTVGNVDSTFVAPGIGAGPSGNVVLRTNEISIDEAVIGRTVTLTSHTPGTAIALGGKPGTRTLGVTAEELGRVRATTLVVGDADAGSINVMGAISGSAQTFSSLVVETAPASSFTVAAASPLTVPGNLTILTGSVVANSTLSSLNGDIAVSADAMAFNAAVNANAVSGTIFITPRSASTAIYLGGPDGTSGNPLLGLDATDTGNLHSAFVKIGNDSTASITVSAPTHLHASSAALTTRMGGAINVNSGLDNTGDLFLVSTTNGFGNGPINVNGPVASLGGALSLFSGGLIVANGRLSSAGDLSLVSTTGNITVNGELSAGGDATLRASGIALGSGSSIAGANVTLDTRSGRAVLGTLAPGADLFLDQGMLNRIVTPGTLTVSAGEMVVTGPVSITTAANLALRASTMDVAGTVTLDAPGGVISVAPNSFFSIMRLGGPFGPSGPGGQRRLELSDAEIDRFVVPNGVLRLGDQATTAGVTIEGPISLDPDRVKTLTLASGGVKFGTGITQTAGSTITVQNLRLQTGGTVTLTEENVVGTLAGSNGFGTFAFTNAGPLIVGPTVDGIAGLQGGWLTLKSDDISLVGPGTINTTIATLAPRNAGAAMNLGSNPGGTYGLDAAELSQITSFYLTLGSNTGGPVTVSAPLQRPDGTVRIVTAPTQVVDVNAAVSAPYDARIDAGTINVAQPITAGTSVGLYADTTNIAAPVTAGAVTIAPATMGRPTSLGVETAGALSLTQAELAFITTDNLTIGGSILPSPTTSSITIGAPLDLNVDTLNLVSIGPIAQAVDAPIRLTRIDSNGQRTGNLDVRTIGAGDENASIFLPAANEVPGTLSFATRGTNNDFDFAYASPIKPQVIVDNEVSGKVNIAPFAPPPPAPETSAPPATLEEQALSILQAQVVSSMESTTGINDTLALTNRSEEDKKKAEDEEKKQQEGK